jgi:hypothetical protein
VGPRVGLEDEEENLALPRIEKLEIISLYSIKYSSRICSLMKLICLLRVSINGAMCELYGITTKNKVMGI